MPPETAIVKFNEFTDEHIEVRGLEHVLSFVDGVALGIALSQCGFTQLERVKRLIEIARTGKDGESMRAMSMLDKLIKDTLELNGLIGILSASETDAKGTTREFRAKLVGSQVNTIRSMINERPDARSTSERTAVPTVINPA